METKTKTMWAQVMEGKKNDSNKGIANRLTKEDVTTVLATMDFFGATDAWLRQTYYDLTVPKYRVFDWLAMSVMGRNDDDREANEPALKVLCHAFLTGGKTPQGFIDNLRFKDYQCDTAWEAVVID
jgi:hypothetical protein